MDFLKTPHEKLMEEAGVNPASNGWLNTPKQMLMEEVGTLPHLADGGHLSPEQMQAALIANNRTPPRFQFAEGGGVHAQFSREEFSALHPLFVALGLINSDDHIKYNK
jgi:hypothetical protein